MGWKVYADSYNTDAELSSGSKSVRAKMNEEIILRYVRTWIVFNNDPGLTNITMKIYSDDNDSKGFLLHSSTTTHTKANIITATNGVKEVYFAFDDIALDSENYYQFVLTGTSSGFSSSSHVAWKLSYPDPVYSSGFTNNYENLLVYPYDLVLIGAKL